MPQPSIYAIVASLGAALGSIATHFFKYRQRVTELEFDEAAQIRKELKDRCKMLEDENATLQKQHYYEMNILKEQIFNLQSELRQLQNEMKSLQCKQLPKPPLLEVLKQ